MPTLKILRHGSTAGHGNAGAKPPERTQLGGWSASSIRRNQVWLYRVDERLLDARQGWALTLTVRTCPPADEWVRMREAFLEVLRRRGLMAHWVVEWQRRGVPHLHLGVYGPPGVTWGPAGLKEAWLRIAKAHRPSLRAQHATAIHDTVGWNRYVSKHAARGLRHYQRSPEAVPESWKGASTGRMWGYIGDWQPAPVYGMEIGWRTYHRLRRLLRSYLVARARTIGDTAQEIAARRMLQRGEAAASAVRGFNKWVPQEVTLQLLHVAQLLTGEPVHQRA